MVLFKKNRSNGDSFKMNDAKKKRVDLNNNWPKELLFPSEVLLKQKMSDNGLCQIFSPAQLKHTNNTEFHNLLRHYLECLNQLPLRPDIAFDCIWKALDAEFFRLKNMSGSRNGRFSVFYNHISKSSETCNSYASLTDIIPLQTCEFVAKRIFENNISFKSNPSDTNVKSFRNRVIGSLTESVYTDLLNKYEPDWLSDKATTQRNVGRLLQRLLKGDELSIVNEKYQLTTENRALFLTAVTMPQFRNERFHGETNPPFRSSSAKLKTYAHAYYIFHVAYIHLLEVFLYRNFNVIDIDTTQKAIDENKELFLKVFSGVINK